MILYFEMCQIIFLITSVDCICETKNGNFANSSKVIQPQLSSVKNWGELCFNKKLATDK